MIKFLLILMIIALTGNIGSGKTSACDIFKKHGYKVINADNIGHQLYKKNKVTHARSEQVISLHFCTSGCFRIATNTELLGSV